MKTLIVRFDPRVTEMTMDLSSPIPVRVNKTIVGTVSNFEIREDGLYGDIELIPKYLKVTDLSISMASILPK